MVAFGDEAWRKKAVCKDEDPDIFFSPEGEIGVSRTRRENSAKAVSAECPVKTDCQEHAIAYEDYGTWGGLTENDRRRLRQSTYLARMMLGQSKN